MKNNEVWVDVTGYEGLYEVSNSGEIRSVERISDTKKYGGYKRKLKGRVLAQIKTPSGYKVALYKNQKRSDVLVARIICKAFISDIEDEELTVNHKDGNRFNNSIENLEWLSRADNIRHAYSTGLMSTCQSVVISESGSEKTFVSMAEASRYLGKDISYVRDRLKKGIKKPARNKNGVVVHIRFA